MPTSSTTHSPSKTLHDDSKKGFPRLRSHETPIDARWNMSYGIKFSNTPKNQTWQPLQGIASSPYNLARQPYSTVPKKRDRIIPSAPPYQSPSSFKSHGLELSASGVASQEDLVVDNDEDIGELHERASRQSGGISVAAAGYSEQATAAAANDQNFRVFGRSKTRLANGSLMHNKFCRRRDRQFLDKPSSCIKRRRRARWRQRTLRSFLWKLTSPRSEQQKYYALKLRTLSSDVDLSLVTEVGRSWRPLVFALKKVSNAMRENPRALPRLDRLMCIPKPMSKAYRALVPAMHEHEIACGVTLSVDPSEATAISYPLHIPDFFMAESSGEPTYKNIMEKVQDTSEPSPDQSKTIKLGRGRLEFGQNRFNLQATTVLERDKNHAGCCELSRTSANPLDCRTSEWPSSNRQAVKVRVDGRLNSWSSQKRALHCASLCSPDVTEELGGTLKSSSLSTDNACSPLGFHIADPAERVSQSSRDMKPLFWEYSLYRGPLGEKVKVHYCKSLADTERIARHFFDQEVIGFDIEWKSNASAKEGIKKNVALIQIASEERIALFHIARFRGGDTVDNLVPENFKYIMQSPRITKVGVSIKADCTRLRRFMGIESRGLFELSHLYKLVKYSPNDASSVDKRLVRLATQVEEHLGLPLWKGQDVRSSDWSADLNYEQVQYAASDSYAGFQLYYALEHKRLSLDPTPPRPYHAELNLPIRLSSGHSISTDDEQTDIEEGSPMTNDNGNPPSVEELARDFLKIKLQDPHITASKGSKKAPTSEVARAQNWVAGWRTTLPATYKPTASPASLRAYALWHEQKYSVPEAAALLRDPPLQNATVAGYVIEALRLEKFSFEKERLDALLMYIPEAGKARYRKFIKESGLGDLD